MTNYLTNYDFKFIRGVTYLNYLLFVFVFFSIDFNIDNLNYETVVLAFIYISSLILLLFIRNYLDLLLIVISTPVFIYIDANYYQSISVLKSILSWLFNSNLIIVGCH